MSILASLQPHILRADGLQSPMRPLLSPEILFLLPLRRVLHQVRNGTPVNMDCQLAQILEICKAEHLRQINAVCHFQDQRRPCHRSLSGAPQTDNFIRNLAPCRRPADLSTLLRLSACARELLGKSERPQAQSLIRINPTIMLSETQSYCLASTFQTLVMGCH